MTLWLAQVQEEEQRSLYSLQSSTNRFSDKIVQAFDTKSYVTTFDIPTNPPIKKNTVVEFTAVAQKDSFLSRGKISGPSIQISLSITHKDVFGNKVVVVSQLRHLK